ncbi:hypothetical protein LTR86_001316 [Recurvomyces mirabilis]|nr:hypothetical protein LTR86_001316 [Recurvomyces mirabilis]
MSEDLDRWDKAHRILFASMSKAYNGNFLSHQSHESWSYREALLVEQPRSKAGLPAVDPDLDHRWVEKRWPSILVTIIYAIEHPHIEEPQGIDMSKLVVWRIRQENCRKANIGLLSDQSRREEAQRGPRLLLGHIIKLYDEGYLSHSRVDKSLSCMERLNAVIAILFEYPEIGSIILRCQAIAAIVSDPRYFASQLYRHWLSAPVSGERPTTGLQEGGEVSGIIGRVATASEGSEVSRNGKSGQTTTTMVADSEIDDHEPRDDGDQPRSGH